ncbi:MAG: hypothetical protein KBA75_06130 [Alphaproteobacteria bacterium]|nr:hypothetical protein [Alphaproteobacteria bacterium]
MSAQPAPANNEENPDQRMKALAVALRHVGGPLLVALLEAAPQEQGPSGTVRRVNLEAFPILIDSAANLARQIADVIEGEAAPASLRWGAISAACQLVAANYKATGQPLDAETAGPILDVVNALPEKFKNLTTGGIEPVPNQVATFRAKMLEALVPVVGAVAQYSFGRAEHGLLAEVAERLMKTADQITRSLAPVGSTPEQWRLLCWVVLKSAGQIYADSHYAEADRLLYMNPDDRAAYFAKHGNVVPMTQVWQEFNQRMALLATLGAYLEVPPAAKLDEEGWN